MADRRASLLMVLWVAVTALGVTGLYAVADGIDEPVGRLNNADHVFWATRALRPGATVRIEIMETTTLPGQAPSVVATTTEFDFGAGQGRSTASVPVPVEYRFDGTARWLRVVDASLRTTGGRHWVKVPNSSRSPAVYDFSSRRDPTGRWVVLRGATKAFDRAREEAGGAPAVRFEVEFDRTHLEERAPVEWRDEAAALTGSVERGSERVTAWIDAQWRLRRVRFGGRLASRPGEYVWDATYTYDVPVDVVPPPARDSVVVGDPARAARLAGVQKVGS